MFGRSTVLKVSPVILIALTVIALSGFVDRRAQAEPDAQRATPAGTVQPVQLACPRPVNSDSTNATAPATETLTQTEQNKVILCRYYELLNQGDLNGLSEVVDANVVDRNPIIRQTADLEGFKQGLGVFRRGFPDLTFAVNDLIAEGDQVVSRVSIQGTNRGTFLGLAPTGRRITFQGIEIYRVANGKIVDVWHVEDLQRVKQLLTPPPTPCLPITATPSPTRTQTATKTTTPVPTATVVPPIVTPNPNPSFLGIRARTVDDNTIRIVEIFDGSPAVKADLRRGDDIIALDGQPLSTYKMPADQTLAAAFFRVLDAKHPGDKIKLTVIRRGQQLEIEVTLGVLPPGFRVTPVAVIINGEITL
ncbi:MAG: ester cyclase [Anaerolineae bacterium]|nr:ester cyclase [Anaerolineae bacterium]